MRRYFHSVEEEYIAKKLQRHLSKLSRNLEIGLGKDPDLSYYLSTATMDCYEAIAVSWAMEDDASVAYFRDFMGYLGSLVLERFSGSEIQREIGLVSLSGLGLATDPAIVRQVAAIVHETAGDEEGQFRSPGDQQVPLSAGRYLGDALAALVVGDDELARSAVISADEQLNAPTAPPGWYFEGLPHAIDAVVRSDLPALTEAADHTIGLYIEQFGPSKDYRAGATSLLYAALTVICRVALWRGMTIPDRPYIMPIIDQPGEAPRSS